jgi:hypothetical protein
MNGYGSEVQKSYDGPSLVRPVTIRVELQLHIKHLEEQLEVKKQLLSLLDANPAIEQFMDLSRR